MNKIKSLSIYFFGDTYMREVTIKVYEYSELSEEAKELARDQARDSMDLSDELFEHLNAQMKGHGLEGVTVDEENFSLNDEDAPDLICLEGEITEFVRENISVPRHVKSAFVDFDDMSDPEDINDSGVSIFFTEDSGIDEEREEDYKEEINKKLGVIRQKLLDSANIFMTEKTSDEVLAKLAEEKEYIEDGTVFE